MNDDVLNGTVVMILFTCIISSVATERAARRMVTQENLTGNDDKIIRSKNGFSYLWQTLIR